VYSILALCTDILCRRYLRARKFTPNEALKQFEETEKWRRENHLEEYYDQIDVQEYEAGRRLVGIPDSTFAQLVLTK
jgi:predicted transcriptional regulator